jgi:hypothetical protein
MYIIRQLDLHVSYMIVLASSREAEARAMATL